MHAVMRGLLNDNSPEFTKKITEGLAVEELRYAAEYLDKNIRSAMVSAPKELEYHGFRRLSPIEEFNSLFNKSGAAIEYDIGRSDLYKIELNFTYMGERLPNRYVLLPFVGPGGIMHISDTKYNIVPVLSDAVISPESNKVFVKLMIVKLNYERESRNILRDGHKIDAQIVYSNIFRTGATAVDNNLGSVVPPTALYLLAKYGYVGTFRRYADGNLPIIKRREEITEQDREQYTIFGSTGIKPKKLKDDNVYSPVDVCFLVDKKVSDDTFIVSMVSSMIYTLDFFHKDCNEIVNAVLNNNKDECTYWKILIGRIVFKDGLPLDRIMKDTTTHFTSLESHLDAEIKDKLRAFGTHVDNFFDLNAVLLRKFNSMLMNSKEYAGNAHNRYLEVLYYVLYDNIDGCNRALSEITRKSFNGKKLSLPEVNSIFNNHLSHRKIFSLIKGDGLNICTQLVDSTSDNMFMKLTSSMEIQERGNGVKRGKNSAFPKNLRNITAAGVYMGSMLYLQKKAPTTFLRLNPYVRIQEGLNKLLPAPNIVEDVKLLDKELKGRDSNVHMKELAEDTEIVEIKDI